MKVTKRMYEESIKFKKQEHVTKNLIMKIRALEKAGLLKDFPGEYLSFAEYYALRILGGNEYSIRELWKQTTKSYSDVYAILKRLREKGFIQVSKKGKRRLGVYYKISPSGIAIGKQWKKLHNEEWEHYSNKKSSAE